MVQPALLAVQPVVAYPVRVPGLTTGLTAGQVQDVKVDTSKHHHIFVGDLSPSIESQTLREAFASFGQITDARVVRDPVTLRSKGYGFVSFLKKKEAESAIATMNGQWLGDRSIRTNWASRRTSTSKEDGGSGTALTFEQVYHQSSTTNSTVYIGGITNGLSEELLHSVFTPFGTVQEIRIFKEKGYAFVRFSTKEAATNAIMNVNNKDIAGQTVKCSWGKECTEIVTNVPNTIQSLAPAQYVCTAPYSNPSAYWYPQPIMQGSHFPTPMALPIPILPSACTASSYGGYENGYIGQSNGLHVAGTPWIGLTAPLHISTAPISVPKVATTSTEPSFMQPARIVFPTPSYQIT